MSSKKTPCDECRERKRRCSYDKPCQRCIKFEIPCVYTVRTSPADEEYLQQIKLLEQVDSLHGQLDAMQQEMISLHVSSTNSTLSSPLTDEYISSPSSTHSLTHSGSGSASVSFSSSYSNWSLSDTPAPYFTLEESRIIKRQRTHQGLEATVYEQKQTDNSQWALTVSKGNLIIKTDIKTHAELLDHLYKCVSTLEMNDVVPHSINDFRNAKNGILPKMLQVFVWKRYGRSRFKNITRGFPAIENGFYSDIDNDDHRYALIQQNDAIASITLKLLHAYLCCQHLKHLAIHVPTFLRLLVKPDIMQSPAVLALCALSCTSSCRHIREVLPASLDIVSYGRYFYQSAREIILDMFDHADLETFATYIFLAIYHLQLCQLNECRRFVDMAERISVLLAEELGETQQLHYKPGDHQHEHGKFRPFDPLTAATSLPEKDNMTDDLLGRKLLFRRLELQLFKIISVSQLTRRRHEHKHGSSHGRPLDRRILNLFHGTADLLKPTADDSEQEKRHILLSIYMGNLNKECHNTAHHAPSEDTANYVGIIGHMVEMAQRRFYASLPDSFRLDLPIFDAFTGTDMSHGGNVYGIAAASGRWLTALEQAPDVIPLLTTINVYNEYLMMTRAHITKTPNELEIRESLASYWKQNDGRVDMDYIRARWGDKWVSRLIKLEHLLESKMKDHYFESKANGYSDEDDEDDEDDDVNMHHDNNSDGSGNVANGDNGKKGVDTGIKRTKKRLDQKVVTALLEWGYAGFDDPTAHTAVTVALNTIQILQYIRLRYPCHYNQHVALNAWDILLRAIRFNFGDQSMQSSIQANLLCCLAMMREEFDRAPYSFMMEDYVCKMEQEYNTQFCN